MSDDTFLGKLRHAVAGLVGDDDDADLADRPHDTSVAGRADAPGERPVCLAQKADLDAALDHWLAGRAEIPVGGLHVAGLTKLDSRGGIAAGDRQAKAAQAVRRIVERQLTGQGHYYPVAEDKFLLLFPESAPNDAQVTLSLIAEKIGAALSDRHGKPLVTVKTGSKALTADAAGADPQQLLRDMGAEAVAEEIDLPPERPDWLAAAPQLDQRPDIADMGFVYRPMWWVQKRRVATYLCQPAVVLEGHRMAIGEQVFDYWDAEGQTWRVDTATLMAGARAAQDAFWHGGAAGFAVPVHWRTIANGAHRMHYLTAAWSIPKRVRKRLVLEIVGAPEKLSVESLKEAAQSLQPVCRAVLLGGGPDSRQMGNARLAGCRLVGLDARRAGLSAERLTAALRAFAQAAQAQHLGCYVHGLTQLETTRAAIEAGFDVVDGDIIGPLRREPGEPYNLTPSQLGTAARKPDESGGG